MPTELKPDEFTERLTPIFESVRLRLPAHLQQRDLGYFFPQWRKLMGMKLARTWEIPDAVLGALFTRDIFSGTPVAHVVFFFSLPGTKGTMGLLKAAEIAAKESGCPRISTTAYGALEGERIAEIYHAFGWAMTEKVFYKELNE